MLNLILKAVVYLHFLYWSFVIIRGVRGIFFRGGKVIFPDFFPGVKCFFPSENSHFGRPKTNFSHFEKWQASTKKKVLSSFCNFSSFHFQYSTFPFSIFLLFCSIFPFFLCLSFPGRSAEISRSEVSGGTLPPCLLRRCLSYPIKLKVKKIYLTNIAG